jgi:hypothetical protein
VSEASVARERVAPGSGCTSGTAAIRAVLAVAKAAFISGSQGSTFGSPESAAVTRLESFGYPWEETAVEINHSQEPL